MIALWMDTFVGRAKLCALTKVVFAKLVYVLGGQLTRGPFVNLCYGVAYPTRWRIPVGSVLVVVFGPLSNNLFPGAFRAVIFIGRYVSDIASPGDSALA